MSMIKRNVSNAKTVTAPRQKTMTSMAKNTETSIFTQLKKGDKFGTVYVPTKSDTEKYSIHQIYEFIYSGKFNDLDSSAYNEQASKAQELLESMTRELNVEDGVYTCPDCQYTKIRLVQKQLRSGDESATMLGICMRCEKHIKISG